VEEQQHSEIPESQEQPIVDENSAAHQEQESSNNDFHQQLEQERARAARLEEENRIFKDHLALQQSQKQQVQQPQANTEDYLSDDEAPSWAEVKRYVSEKEKKFEKTYEELRVAQKYKDYQEVIEQHLPDVIKQNPSLRRSLELTQDYELAYHLAKNSDSYRNAKQSNSQAKKVQETNKIISNAKEAGSLSSVSSSSSTGVVDGVQSGSHLNDDDFLKLVRKRAAGIRD